MFITLVMILHFFFNHLTGLVKINNDIKLTNVKQNNKETETTENEVDIMKA